MTAAALIRSGSPDADRVYRKITWRLVPFLFVCYTIAFLDRINLGIAQLEMKHDIGLGDLVYGFGASMFFVGYILMEIPSNLMLGWVGARKTFFRIMLLWGLAAAATAFVTRPIHLYIVRFLLGFFEAGLYPGIIYFFTLWYPLDRRARVIGVFTCSVGIAGLLGGPLSGGLMTLFAGSGGLHGWQWMFLLEGLPACLMAFVTLFFLDDGPQHAKWLSQTEQQFVVSEVEDSNATDSHREHTIGRVLTDWRLYLVGLIGFGHICGLYAIGFWMPTIIKENGVTNPFQVGLISAIPYFWSWIALMVTGWTSDKTGERYWHCVLLNLANGVGLAGIGLFSNNLWLAVASCSVAMCGLLASAPVGWAINTDYMRGRGSAGGIALLNTISLTGGIVSPSMIGWTKTVTGNVSSGLYLMAAIGVLGAFIAWLLVPGMLKTRTDGTVSQPVEVT
jgi:MFS family permease